MRINLDYPVNIEGQAINSLTMRRMKVADALRDYDDNKAKAEMLLFADLCGVTPKTIEELDMVDYESIQSAFIDMRKKPSTPPNSVEQRLPAR